MISNEYCNNADELRCRVLLGVVPSQLQRMVDRVALFSDRNHVLKALPLLNTVLCYILTTNTNDSSPSLKKAAKRWYKANIVRLATKVLHRILLPNMTNDVHMGLQWAFDLATFRLMRFAHHTGSSLPTVRVHSLYLFHVAAHVLLEQAFVHGHDNVFKRI